jgi:glycosyltransferase involved in cell wall biosynthesis
VLASLLKPVDDTRMLEKIGATLADSGLYQVFIIGFPTATSPGYESITFLPLKAFGRLSFYRLKASFEVFRKIHQVKPEHIIINTPELLWVAIVNRIFFGRKITYDVLENYYRNIRFTETYPTWIRFWLAPLVRAIEIVSAPFIHHFLLAEKGYANEFSFAKPYVVLENKLPETIANGFTTQAPLNRLIFSGTLAPTTGILEALELCNGLHKVDPNYTLTIIGYAADIAFLKQLKSKIANKPFIQLIGGGHLVPHNQILHEVSKAGVGIVIYEVNPSTVSSIPTKLYEYLALGKVILVRHNEASHSLVQRLKAGVIIPYKLNFITLDQQIKSASNKYITPPDIYWESQSEKLLKAINVIGLE